jgi:hypothetical protein
MVGGGAGDLVVTVTAIVVTRVIMSLEVVAGLFGGGGRCLPADSMRKLEDRDEEHEQVGILDGQLHGR